MASIQDNPLQILRGASDTQVKQLEEHYYASTTIWDKADARSDEEENKTAITVLLEDYAELADSLNAKGQSCLTAEDAKPYSIWERIFGDCDNIFRDKDVQNHIKNKGSITQNKIFQQEIWQNGGLKYADENDDVVQAALNFAKADINAIEKAYKIANPEAKYADNGFLVEDELDSFMHEIVPGSISGAMYDLDLEEGHGGGSHITAEEYASYMIAVDGLTKDGFSMDNVDGLVSLDEIELSEDIDFDEIKKAAEQIYKENFAKEQE